MIEHNLLETSLLFFHSFITKYRAKLVAATVAAPKTRATKSEKA